MDETTIVDLGQSTDSTETTTNGEQSTNSTEPTADTGQLIINTTNGDQYEHEQKWVWV